VATGRLDDAEAHARRAVSLAEGTDWSTYHAAACIALGEVLRVRGRPVEAETAIRKSLSLYEEKGNVVAAEGARALLSGLVPA
jgi:Flp pilus assembly protein TadD